MTERQVDLLLTDQPLVVYDHEKPSGKGGKISKNVANNAKSSYGDVLEAGAKFAMKHGVGGDGHVDVDFSKVFNKKKHGNDGDGSVSVDMSGFLLKDA